MPNFQYKAKNRTGELITGMVAAGDRRLALAELGRLGYFPLAVAAAAEKETTRKSGWRRSATRRDVQMFTQQLSTLLRSGMSLSQALGVLERRTQKQSFAKVLGEIRNDIVQGDTLSGALGKQRPLFSDFHVNLVRAGEASGALEDVLARLAKHYEEAGELQDKVVGALIYPLIIGVVGLGTIIFFMMVMVPKFATMFREMGRAMPLPTQILIGISDVVTKFWWAAVIVIGVTVLVSWQRSKTVEGRLFFDRLRMRLPLLGSIAKARAFAQFARTLATLLENGVPVLTALEIVEQTMTNKVIAGELHEARVQVTDGTSISQPLAKGKVFPPLLLDMLAVGEESGEVVPALNNIATMYEQDLAQRLRVFTTLLEPLIILFMALVVGSVVLSILLAVFDITSGIGK